MKASQDEVVVYDILSELYESKYVEIALLSDDAALIYHHIKRWVIISKDENRYDTYCFKFKEFSTKEGAELRTFYYELGTRVLQDKLDHMKKTIEQAMATLAGLQ